MKTFINRFRWLYTGIWIGFGIAAWVMSNEDEKKSTSTYTPSDEFNKIYEHYNNKETANA